MLGDVYDCDDPNVINIDYDEGINWDANSDANLDANLDVDSNDYNGWCDNLVDSFIDNLDCNLEDTIDYFNNLVDMAIFLDQSKVSYYSISS